MELRPSFRTSAAIIGHAADRASTASFSACDAVRATLDPCTEFSVCASAHSPMPLGVVNDGCRSLATSAAARFSDAALIARTQPELVCAIEAGLDRLLQECKRREQRSRCPKHNATWCMSWHGCTR